MIRPLVFIFFVLLYGSLISQNFWLPLPYPDSTNVICMNVESNQYIYYSNNEDPRGIYRSNNEVIDWEFSNTGWTWAFDMAIDSSGVLFLSCAEAILRSMDNGYTFDTLLLISSNVGSIEIDDNNNIWAGFWGGILFSSDNGISWDTVLYTHNAEIFLDFAFGINDEVYAVSSDYLTSVGGFYRSFNNGASWENSGLHGEKGKSIITNHQGDIFVGCGFTGVFRSLDLGLSWTNVKNNLVLPIS